MRNDFLKSVLYIAAFAALVFAVVAAVSSLLFPPRPAQAAVDLGACFPASVARRQEDITRWGKTYQLSPTLIAAVMTVESCGNPRAVSPTGAKGLFQVMPFHFAAGEDPFDPETNARRGLGYLRWALQRTGGNTRLALAVYNGGPGVLQSSPASWPPETQRYVRLTTQLLAEAQAGQCSLARRLCP